MDYPIKTHRYRLNAKLALNAIAKKRIRHGVIVNIDGGYATIHPWPEFGDEELEIHLDSLRLKEPTTLAKRAIHFAAVDRQARLNKKSLFEGLTIPSSHALISKLQSDSAKQFEDSKQNLYIKIKIDADVEDTAAMLSSFQDVPATIRLDANGSYTVDGAIKLWHSLPLKLKEKVEFTEDFCPYIDQDWKILQERHRIPLAYDFYSSQKVKDNYRYRIIKPVVQPYEKIVDAEIKRNRKIVVTSSMDHPFGIAIAAWVSGSLSEKYPLSILPGGYSPVAAFEENSFSLAITDSDGNFKIPHGTGFGFDSLLDELQWEPL